MENLNSFEKHVSGLKKVKNLLVGDRGHDNSNLISLRNLHNILGQNVRSSDENFVLPLHLCSIRFPQNL